MIAYAHRSVYQCHFSETEQREKLERKQLNTPLVAKSSQANVSLVEASVANPRKLMEKRCTEGGGGEVGGCGGVNVTLALICHIVSHRYENTSRLHMQLRHE